MTTKEKLAKYFKKYKELKNSNITYALVPRDNQKNYSKNS